MSLKNPATKNEKQRKTMVTRMLKKKNFGLTKNPKWTWVRPNVTVAEKPDTCPGNVRTRLQAMSAEVAIVSIVENPDIFPENVLNLRSIGNHPDCLVTIAEKSDTFHGNVRTKLAGWNATIVENLDTCPRNAPKLLEPTRKCCVIIATQSVIWRVIVINRELRDPDVVDLDNKNYIGGREPIANL